MAVADAWVEEARAALGAIEAQIERMTIAAPIDGIVLEQTVHVGELAAPGVPLITLANLDVVELTVYVPEDQFDEVSLNQQVQIRVDSFPGQTFEGAVVRIADEAEFTPRGVQTREERVNLVFAVKIQIENPDHVLKPGMPADAVFE
jgi:multidrug resistance efflux pump